MAMDRERAGEIARDATHASGLAANVLLSILVAPLPRAWRAPLEERYGLNGDAVAAPSALLQTGLGFASGFAGFFAYMKGQLGPAGALDLGFMMVNPIQPLIYVLTTPVGLASSLVMGGGILRAIGFAMHREAAPDPLLSLVEWGRQRLFARARAEARELAKGPPAPDSITVGGAHAGFDLRVVTRHDYDWNDTVTILVADEPYRMLRREEIRDEAGRLRNLYDLRRVQGTEAFRGLRRYQPAEAPVVTSSPAR